MSFWPNTSIIGGLSGCKETVMARLKTLTLYTVCSPDVTYYCDLDYDPFLVMQDQGKVYGRVGPYFR